jgi:hypothetical protein
VAIIFLRPQAMNQVGRNLLIVVAVLFIVSRLPVFKEGAQILSERFTTVAEAEERSIAGGLIARTFSGYTEAFVFIPVAPLGGYGLGIGTNGGAKFLTGRSIFLLTEGEWGRVILESGPILGLAYLAWRTIFTFNLGLFSIRQLKRGQILPIMLYGAGFLSLLSGQFGQPTNLGFAVFICGLCLAAGNTAPGESETPPPPAPARRIARRSQYAARLHGAAAARNHPDDFADR